MSRLDSLLSFLGSFSAGSSNPLEALDALYTAILDDVPKYILQTTMQILGFLIFDLLSDLDTAQGHCNFLHIDQSTFYNALQKLHSLIDIPLPESASQRHLRIYHTSFEDYLRDPSRSGKFAIEEDATDLTYAKLCLSWYKTDLELFQTTKGLTFDESRKHGVLPGLSWVLDDNREGISSQIAKEAQRRCLIALYWVETWDEALLSQIRNFDFRYVRTDYIKDYWGEFLNKFWERDPSSRLIRTEPQTEVDFRLLECLKTVVGPLWRNKPATLPLKKKPDQGEYLFLGHGYKAVICWANGDEYFWCSVLNAD